MRQTHLQGLILCLVRLAVAGVVYFYIWQRPSSLSEELVLVVRLLLYFVFGVSLLFLILWRFRFSLLIPQLVFDAAVTSFIIYITGGVASPFLFLFFTIIALGGAWVSTRGGLAFATAFLAAVSSATLLYSKGITLSVIPAETLKEGLSNWQAKLAIQTSLALFIALLSGRLARATRSVQLLYRPILDNIGEGVLAILKSGKIIYANKRFAEMLSLDGDPNSVVGKDIWQVLSAARFGELRKALRMGETTVEIEIECSGSSLAVEVKSWPLKEHRGRHIGQVVMLSDLTVRRQLEETRARAERLRELEEMAVGLAHELRNPLASVRGCAQQLAKLHSQDSLHKQLAEIIVRESDRLDNIVARFMDLARPRPLTVVRTDMVELVEEVADLLRRRPETGSVSIDVKAKQRHILHCDPERIKQVFLNIGINALEAMRGSGSLTIEVAEGAPIISSQKSGLLSDGVIVRFTDTGPGIRAKDTAKIFLPFFTTKSDGVGMGLAIANKNVAEHGGLIAVDSRLGEGTTFTIWLPRVPRHRGGSLIGQSKGSGG